MNITLAPYILNKEIADLTLDLSELDTEGITEAIRLWTEENGIESGGWAVYESDDEFQPVLDSTDPEVWAAWKEAYEEHGDAILKFWDDVLGFTYYKDVAKVLEYFESAYQGEYSSSGDWARDFIDSCYTLEGPLKDYFDYEKYADDAQKSGDRVFIDADNGNVFAFNRNF